MTLPHPKKKMKIISLTFTAFTIIYDLTKNLFHLHSSIYKNVLIDLKTYFISVLVKFNINSFTCATTKFLYMGIFITVLSSVFVLNLSEWQISEKQQSHAVMEPVKKPVSVNFLQRNLSSRKCFFFFFFLLIFFRYRYPKFQSWIMTWTLRFKKENRRIKRKYEEVLKKSRNLNDIPSNFKK